MAKSSYLSNSAKILSVLAAMQLVANIVTAIAYFTQNNDIAYWGTMFSNFCLYVVLVMGYIAFNGEAVAHKRSHNRKRKKVLGFFKLLLFFCFVYTFLRWVIESKILALPVDSVNGIFYRLLTSLFSTAGTYGFLFGALSLWYVIRDKGNLKLMLPELVSLFISILYNLFKFFECAVERYGLPLFGEGFAAVICDSTLPRVLCILQYLFNCIMLVCIAVYYDKKGEEEQKILDQNVKTLAKARNIIKDDGYGVDTLEDDFLLTE